MLAKKDIFPLILTISLALAISLGGCRSRTIEPGPPGQYSDYYWGELSGSRNGINYFVPRISGIYDKASVEPCRTQNFGIQIIEYDKGGLQRTGISFAGIPRKVGIYRTLTSNLECRTDSIPSAYFHLLEGDVLLNNYLPVPSANNHLTISSFNMETGEVKGSFDFTTVAQNPPRENNPDTVRCIGQFQTRLRDIYEKYK